DDQNRPHPARLTAGQEAAQLILGLEPTETVQVDARLDRPLIDNENISGTIHLRSRLLHE
ncbi:MAG: hypothetical protein LCH57_02045, partial [Proteobacteria bacterium]|nr:hypothetical protein [Pseudomonadota bacterium]